MSVTPPNQGFRYRLFGLTMQSDIEIPQLPPVDSGGIDVTISRTRIHHRRRREGGEIVDLDPETQYLAWEGIGAFQIPSTDHIEVDSNPGVSDALVALPLLGVVIAMLLHRRGFIVLHASAASLYGQGIALMGDKGAGKSTTAGALVKAGHLLLSDDVVALAFAANGEPEIVPAFGQLKLWDDAAAGLESGDLRSHGRVHPSVAKSHYSLRAGFSLEAAPAKRLYVLARAETASVSTMEPPLGLEALLHFAYLARFGEAGFGLGMGEYFRRSAELTNAGRVRLLRVPQGIGRIAEAIEAIEQDLGTPFPHLRTATVRA